MYRQRFCRDALGGDIAFLTHFCILGFMLFFVLSKLLWSFVMPLNLCAILLCAGAVLSSVGRERMRRAGKFLIGSGIVLLLGFGVMPLGHDTLVLLEARYPPLDTKRAGSVDGIILLGGAVETRIPAINGLPEINDNADRITEFVRLARLHPQARLVFTGGSAEITGGGGPPEADLIAPLLETLGLGGRGIVYERQSRNTYENVILSRDLVKPKAGERWILVTSAFHMPRSVAVFESAGWPVIPAPSDFRTDGKIIILPRRFDVLRAMEESGIAIKELIGFVAYSLSGKISSPARER